MAFISVSSPMVEEVPTPVAEIRKVKLAVNRRTPLCRDIGARADPSLLNGKNFLSFQREIQHFSAPSGELWQ
jgi:hypothetical protein